MPEPESSGEPAVTFHMHPNDSFHLPPSIEMSPSGQHTPPDARTSVAPLLNGEQQPTQESKRSSVDLTNVQIPSRPAVQPGQGSPTSQHYLRRNEWLRHAAIQHLQFEESARNQASPAATPRRIHPPSYYNSLLTRDPANEQEQQDRELAQHRFQVYGVDMNAPPPARVNVEEMDAAIQERSLSRKPSLSRKSSASQLQPVSSPSFHIDEPGVTKPAEQKVVQKESDVLTKKPDVGGKNKKDVNGFETGQPVPKPTQAWALIQNPPEHGEHGQTAPETPEDLDTTVYTGLTQQVVDERQARDGRNELKEKRPSLILKFISYFIDPIGLLIMAAAIISGVLSDWVDFGVITGLLFLNAIIGFVEENRAENAVAALQQKLALKTHVLRPGEVRAGLEGITVTDEEKHAEAPASTDASSRFHMVSVKELVRGDIFALRIGDIVPADARLLGLNKQHVLTDDSLMIDQSALTGESLPVEKRRGELVYSGSTVKQGQMLAVVTQTGERTFLGRAAHLISNTAQSGHFQQVISRIGYFLIGITLVLVGIILLVGVLAYGHAFLDELEQALVLTIAAIPVGMPTVLSVTMAVGSKQLSKKQVIVKRLTAVEEMAAVEVLCSDKTGTLTLNELTLDQPYLNGKWTVEDLLFSAFLGSEASATDAIEECVRKTAVETLPSLKGTNIHDINPAGYKILQFHPFDPISKLTRATVKNETDGTIFCVAKGAPHVILKLCDDDEHAKERAEEAIVLLAKRGLRALGVARSAPISDVNQTGIKWQLVGLLSLLDPPRPDSKQTVQYCQEYGISVKMITGDAVLIAKEVSKRLGLFANILPPSSLTVTNTRTEEQVVSCVQRADGFAQVVPEDKYRIVETLQEAGQIVAMTGDGVNDAPALKKANVGIAVSGCTDAARSAADIVLLRPGLSTIVDGIITSRQIFQRMHSYATYRITSTIHFLLFFFITILAFDFTLPAILIILIAALNDAAVLVVSIDNARVSKGPDKWHLNQLLITSFVLAICLTISSLAHYFVGRYVFNLSTEELQTVIYLQMSSCPHFVIFSTRVRSWFWSNTPAPIFVAAIAGTQIFAYFICVFGKIPPKAIGWGWCSAVMAISLGVFVIMDAVKVGLNHMFDSPKYDEYMQKLFPTKARARVLAERRRISRYHRVAHVARHMLSFIYSVTHRNVNVKVDDVKTDMQHDSKDDHLKKLWEPLKLESTNHHNEQEEKQQSPSPKIIQVGG